MTRSLYRWIHLMAVACFTMAFQCEDECDEIGIVTVQPNLIQLTPVQTSYSQGDVLNLSLSISDMTSFNENAISLLEETGSEVATVIFSEGDLFLDNSVIVNTGDPTDNSDLYLLNYDPSTDLYTLNLDITLDRVGTYNFASDEEIVWEGSNCERFRINTNIQWPTFGTVEFEVVP